MRRDAQFDIDVGDGHGNQLGAVLVLGIQEGTFDVSSIQGPFFRLRI